LDKEVVLRGFDAGKRKCENFRKLEKWLGEFGESIEGLTVDFKLKVGELLKILGSTKRLKKLEILKEIIEEDFCQQRLSIVSSFPVLHQLQLQSLKIENCDEVASELFLLLPSSTIIELNLVDFPILELPKLIVAQHSISCLRLHHSLITVNQLEILKDAVGILQLSKFSLHLDFIEHENPKFETIIVDIINSQPNLTHLDLNVPIAGAKIFTAISKLPTKVLVMRVPGKALEARMMFKAPLLESLTIYGPKSACGFYFALKNDYGKSNLMKFAVRFTD
jgi:hypothetical protein